MTASCLRGPNENVIDPLVNPGKQGLSPVPSLIIDSFGDYLLDLTV